MHHNHKHTEDNCLTCNDGSLFRAISITDEIHLDIESLKLIKDIASTMLKNKPIKEEFLGYIDNQMKHLNEALYNLRNKGL
jgi:hypothetical protein